MAGGDERLHFQFFKFGRLLQPNLLVSVLGTCGYHSQGLAGLSPSRRLLAEEPPWPALTKDIAIGQHMDKTI